MAAVAGVFHVINHATFKASLFMAAGIIDHETGTRDMRKLGGLFHYMPVTATLAMVASAAMAGVPLLNGFLSKEMFFAEAIEMGQFGAKSMHPLALEPAAEHGIPVRMRNTFRPEGSGTRIEPAAPDAAHPVKCVLQLKNAALLTVSGAAMSGRPGTAAAVFRALAAAHVHIMMISQSVSEAGITLVVSKDQAERARSILERTLMRTGVARGVSLSESVCVVAAVGGGMHGVPGIAAKVFSAVAEKKINVIAIAQGSSELSISFVVGEQQASDAVRALHAAFIG